MRILHIIADDTYAQSTQRLFLESDENVRMNFVCVRPSQKCGHATTSPIEHWEWLSILNSCANYDVIFVHQLGTLELKFVNEVSKGPLLVWNGLGSDYYDLICPGTFCLLLPTTKRLMAFQAFQGYLATRGLAPALRAILKLALETLASRTKRRRKTEIGNRFDFFSPVLSREFRVLQNELRTVKYLDWNYAPEMDFFTDATVRTLSEKVGNPAVMVGNRSAWELNHVEAFVTVRRYFDNNTEVVVPVTYGDAGLAKALLKKGREILGERVSFLSQHLSVPDFMKVLARCDLLLLNSKRQIGAGTARLAFLVGIPVALRLENPLYQEYRELGFTVFSVEHLRGFPSFSEKEVLRNQELARHYFSKDFEVKRTSNALRQLREEMVTRAQRPDLKYKESP